MQSLHRKKTSLFLDHVLHLISCHFRSYTVLLGVHIYGEKTNGIQKIPVDQAFPRKDYNATDLTNDIMLLKVKHRLTPLKLLQFIAKILFLFIFGILNFCLLLFANALLNAFIKKRT